MKEDMKIKILLVLSLFTLIFAATACDSVLYFPTHDIKNKPEDFGVTAESIWFQNEEGANLHGLYFQRSDLEKAPRAVFVFFHGNGSNLTGHFPHLLWILKQGFDFFIFDYQGYGESPGKPTPKGTVLDGKAAIRYTVSRNPEIPLVVFGQSLGGAVALRTVIEMKDEVKPALVIADSTFTSYHDVAKAVANRLGMGDILGIFLPSDEFAPGDRVKEISPTPLLVYHGNIDKVVDYKFGLDLFEKSAEPKEFWTIFNGSHTDAFSKYHGGLYREAVMDKLSRIGL